MNFHDIYAFNNTIVNNVYNGSNSGGYGFDLLTWPITPTYPFTATLSNNIVVNNDGCGINGYNGVTLYIDYNDVFGNDYDYCSRAEPPDGIHNISADPLFVSPELGNYHLRPGSPAINTGDNSIAPAYDFDGVPRPQDLYVDMGAFEFILNKNFLPIILNQQHTLNPSWREFPSGVNTDLNSVSMISSNLGFTVGKSGRILQWNGQNWEIINSPVAADLRSVSIGSANNAWIVGGTTILNWNGTNWIQDPGAPSLPFYGVDADANGAWLVGGYLVCNPNCGDMSSFISHWDGSTWQTAYSQHKYLYSIDMLNTSDGWAVGDIYDPTNPLPAIIRWDGSTWNDQIHPGVRGLVDISALDSNNAWAVGADPNYICTILRWNGSSWTSYNCPDGVNGLSAISMVSSNDVWAVGGNNIIHWDGSNWTRISYTPSYPLKDIDMISSSEGWAVGNNGIVLHYAP